MKTVSHVGWKYPHFWGQHIILVVVTTQMVLAFGAPEACNEPSSLLSDEENKLLFKLVGKKRQSKAAAVVQMFHANEDGSSGWTKYKTGVVVLVEHSSSYYIKLFDLTVSYY